MERINVPSPEDCLSGGGEMGTLMRTFDWSQTPLGPVASWSQSLRTAVSILLASRFPMQILWGSEYVQLYNDAYRPILGAKHPKALGQRGCECWQEVWDFVGPRLDHVRATGEATWSDDQQLLIDRNGYVEECYFTFSYSPLRDESGGVGGIFIAVTETTQRVLGERRQRALRSLALGVFEAKTAQEACAIAARTLANHSADIPFALLYLLDAEGKQAKLSGTVGLEPDTPASPRLIDLRDSQDKPPTWSLARVMDTHQAALVQDLEGKFGSLPLEPWGVPPHSALVLPISLPGEKRLAGFLVAGISPRHALDDDYRSFFELMTGHIALAIANAFAYEEQRKRADSASAASTARRVAEAAQQRVTQILESITDGFASFDRQWRYTYVNQEAARLVRKTPEELIGNNVWQEFPEAIGSRFYHEYHRALAEQVSIEFEEFYPPLNVWFQIRIYPSSEGISVYYRDVTERKRVEEALQQSEARYRRIVETSFEGIWTIDSQARTEFSNPRMAEMLGYTVEEMQGRPIFDFMDEAARVEAQRKLAWLKQGNKELKEARLRRKDGSDIWTLISANPILDEEGEFKGAIAMVSDISDRKQAQEQLWETNQTLNSIIQACPLAITVFSLDDGRVKLWNPAAERIFGWSEQEALGCFLPSVPEDKRDEFLANLGAIRQGRELTRVELRRQKKDGSPIDIALWATALRDAKGDLNCMSILADISDRKRLEEKLRSALTRLTSHVENSPLGVVEWDREFRITRWSKQAEKLFGWEASEVLGKHPHEWQFVYAEDFKATEDILERLANGTEQQNVASNRNYTKDGRVVHCEWYNSALVDESGKMVSVLSLVLDVTERKRAEAERAREAAERQRLLKLEQKARAQAEAANRIKDEFLAVLSHELRSPLNPILGWTNILRTRKCDEKTTSRALEIIERNAKLQTQLIEDLLDVSRILQGKLSLNISPVNLTSTIEAAIETVRLAAQAKSIQIETVFEPNVGLLAGDGNRLQQVVWNLVSNAVKFTPPGGRVEVRLSVVHGSSFMVHGNEQLTINNYVQIDVSDTGKGINPDFLPHVFDYFRQADSTTTRTFGGLGLGLAIVRHLVELHGGIVQVESPGEGQGATFTVKLPLMTTHSETNSESGEPTCAVELNGIRVLVVDDEADTREFLSFLLEEYGAKVTAVPSAFKALEALRQAKPDLLLSDIGMPEMDGYMLIRQIRAMPPEQGGQIPAIALTAYAGETDHKQVLAAGFQKHVTKPVEPAELVAAIANLVRCQSNE